MAQVRAEASLSATSGTPNAAPVEIAMALHGDLWSLLAKATTRQLLSGKVWWWWYVGGRGETGVVVGVGWWAGVGEEGVREKESGEEEEREG